MTWREFKARVEELQCRAFGHTGRRWVQYDYRSGKVFEVRGEYRCERCRATLELYRVAVPSIPLLWERIDR